MRMFLQLRSLVMAVMCGATCWASLPAGAEEEASIVPPETLTDRIFADPQLCLDLDAPAEQFFREVLDDDPFQANPEAASPQPQNHEPAARGSGTVQRTMRELLDEPPPKLAAFEAERLFGPARWTHDLDTPPPVKHFRADGVLVYAQASEDRKSNDSITGRLRRAASSGSSMNGIGLPSRD